MKEIKGTSSQNDEVRFYLEVSDEALEAAANIADGRALVVTLGFCSGLDTCPA